MAKIIVCLVLSLLCAFMSYSSFMSRDYQQLQDWMEYYTEYKALQSAKDKGQVEKAELLSKLKKMYPERAKQWEQSAKDSFSDMQDSAASAESSISNQLHSSDTTESAPQKQQAPAAAPNKNSPASTSKNQQPHTDTVKTNTQNNKTQ